MTTPAMGAMRSPLVNKEGYASREFLQRVQEWETKLANALTILGEIKSGTKIQGRTEGIGTTVGQLDAGGVVLAGGADMSRAYANKNLDNIADTASFVKTTPNEKTGAGRGYVALDSNNRLAGTFRNNAVNVTAVPTAATDLSNDGASNVISIAANTKQYGDGAVAYNSGSVNPGAYGTYFVYADDPTFAGGAVTYQFTTSVATARAGNGRILFGKITTTGGTPQTGGGDTGGSTPGGGGGGGYFEL